MAGQNSHKWFFRRIPNIQLGHYFHEKRKVLLEIDFDRLKGTEAEPIFQAVTALAPEQQAEIEAKLQDIDNWAYEGGVSANFRTGPVKPEYPKK